jgi:hypothetical protein
MALRLSPAENYTLKMTMLGRFGTRVQAEYFLAKLLF